MKYPIVVTPDGDGFLVTCPQFPEVTTDADRAEDAPARAMDAIEEAIAGRLEAFEEIPRPVGGDVMADPISTNLALKVALYWRLEECDETRAGLARRLRWNRTSVDRLFKPLHQSRVEQFDAAFAALNARVSIEVAAA